MKSKKTPSYLLGVRTFPPDIGRRRSTKGCGYEIHPRLRLSSRRSDDISGWTRRTHYPVIRNTIPCGDIAHNEAYFVDKGARPRQSEEHRLPRYFLQDRSLIVPHSTKVTSTAWLIASRYNMTESSEIQYATRRFSRWRESTVVHP